VVYVGKPHRAVYEAAVAVLRDVGGLPAASLGPTTAPASACLLCAVGDVLATDIRGGGQHLGPDAGKVLIAHGVHAHALGVDEGEGQIPQESKVSSFLADQLRKQETAVQGTDDDASWDMPTHVAPAFVW